MSPFFSFIGWEACSRALLAIVSKGNRVEEQLIPFITLIRLLKDQYNCFQGAVQLAQAIDSVILSASNPPKLTPSQVNAYVKLCLEEDMKADNPDRMPLLGPFCCNKLNTSQQCSLATHLADRHPAVPFFNDLLKSLAHKCDLIVMPGIKDYTVDLLFCYLDAGLLDLFNDLAPKFLVDPQVVETILASSKIWERTDLDGEPGRAELLAVLPSFVKSRIATLTSLLEQNSNQSLDSSNDEELSCALELVVRLMETTGLTDLEGLAIIHPLFSRMSPTKMSQLVLDSMASQGETKRSLFLKFCQRVGLPDRVEPDISIEVYRLLKVFSDQGSASEGLLNSLVDAILAGSETPGNRSIYAILVSCLWICRSSKLHHSPLLKGFTTKLLAAWIAIVVDKDDDDGAKLCIEAFIKLKNSNCQPVIDATSLSPFIARISMNDLQFLWTLLHQAICHWIVHHWRTLPHTYRSAVIL